MLDEFSHITRFRVPFADIDMNQHVNHAAYIKWAEQARSDYFADILGEAIHSRRGMIMAKLEYNYERQVDHRENVAIGCRISRIGTKSFAFTYEVWSVDKNQRAGHGVSQMVAYDYEADASIAVPQEWRTVIAGYEKVPPA